AICKTASQSVTEMQIYFQEVIKTRRSQPRDDLLSMFLASQDEESISDEELCAQCVLLITAGNVTTVDLIGNGCHAILSNGEQRKLLMDKPDLLEGAIDEMLRYDSPVQLSHRVALEDIEINEKVIKKGQMAFAVLGAANRDPEHFHDPDAFDIQRKKNDHLAFGTSIHVCIGLWLAKLETQIAIWSLLEKVPTLRLAQEAPKRKTNGPLVRGFSSLTVSW
ncbi:MAG: cytochrome P450, partial [Planctomycetota bacterium]|nr:cytochrome P450 [Planctomycetota bacterium]